MKIKYDGKTIDVKNQSDSKGEFYTYWNDYFIQVIKDDSRSKKSSEQVYVVQCVNPCGGYDVDAIKRGMTIRECVQMCFDNIDVPFMTIDGIEDEAEDSYREHLDIYCP